MPPTTTSTPPASEHAPCGMTMRYPATRWQDSLPVGSGSVGALLYGNIQRETAILNHDKLYYPRAIPPMTDVSDQLPAMRELMHQGKCREAAQLMRDTYTNRTGIDSFPVDPYQPLCSISLLHQTGTPFQHYRRGVDFDTGKAWVSWSDGTTNFSREIFVSRLSDTVFMRLRSSRAAQLSGTLALIKTISEQTSGKLHHTGAKLADFVIETEQTACARNRQLSFQGKYPNGLSFGALGYVEVSGGSITEKDGALVFTDADEVTLQVRLFVGGDPEAESKRIAQDMQNDPTTFDAAFEEHAAAHSALFNRLVLDIGNDNPASNEELLLDAYDHIPADALIRKMCDYGRYLLICSSRPGSMPANLQGIWNGDYAPAWASDIHTDENIQMNYWLALPANLPETLLPMLSYFEHFMDDFRQNARFNFNCRGIKVPLAMTTHGRSTPISYANWTAAAGWIGQHFYDYYLFTGDKDFLRHHAIPWMKETATFYEDFLYEGDDGYLVFNPSVSPENRPANSNSLITMNATMDVAICRETLSNLCRACEDLGIEPESLPKWKNMLAKLPPYQVNADGAIREWMHPAFDDNYHHRHQSHLYPVFPGLEVTPESNPDIFAACRVAVEKRLVIGLTSQTGWSMAHMANIYARLGMGDRALECIDILIRSSVGPNLFTYHNDWRMMGLSSGLSAGHGDNPPFQIDANLGMAAAILEMLAFSKPGILKLLPARPARWKSGKVCGLSCRGGISLDLQWNVDNATWSATLTSKTDQKLQLYPPCFAQDLPKNNLNASAPATSNQMTINLTANSPYTINHSAENPGIEGLPSQVAGAFQGISECAGTE